MRLKEAIDRVDALHPNPYSNDQKTDWINELEQLIQANDYLVRPEDLQWHKYSKTWTGVSVTFPDKRTLQTSVDLDLDDGSIITISNLQTTTANEGTYQIYLANKYEYVFKDEVFTTVTTTAETGTIAYNGTDEELLIDKPWDSMYIKYLIAQIDYANGDYDQYANTREAFENEYSNFRKWFTQHYCNDRGEKYARKRI